MKLSNGTFHNTCIFAMTMNSSEQQFLEKAISAVADPYRMSILQEILDKGSIRCCDVVSLTGLSQPTCSHHIKLLSDSSLIECRKEGRNNYFTLNKENFRRLGHYFSRFSAS
ncbi:MAG: metalloregulator ArsR/SmtB family transcription factor [Ferruginibacter sp.]